MVAEVLETPASGAPARILAVGPTWARPSPATRALLAPWKAGGTVLETLSWAKAILQTTPVAEGHSLTTQKGILFGAKAKFWTLFGTVYQCFMEWVSGLGAGAGDGGRE